jgi:O-methyltransferase
LDGRLIIGSVVPKCRALRHLTSFAYLVEFIKRNPSRAFATREDLYRFVSDHHLDGKPLCLVELGVWIGETIGNWALLNSNPESTFYGLDTFEGLPEEWQHLIGRSPVGTFTAHGSMPSNSDARVTFVKGLIQGTLAPLLAKVSVPQSKLVVHFDADLYSTTLYGLTSVDCLLFHHFDSYIAIFDEFSSVNDEYRAFVDYCSAYRRKFEVIGHVGKCYDKVAIKLLR